jgi:acetyltransferase-like isoleucine patch superfamily enzyme
MMRKARRWAHKFGRPLVVVDGEFVKGEHVWIGENCSITARNLYIGDGVIIEPDVVIEATDLYLGDHTRLRRGSFLSGSDWCFMGANCWIGNLTIVDANGSACLGNNVCAGSGSQLWSHTAFGDTLKGCRYHSSKPLRIADDVWFMGHCTVSPITAGEKSIALAGSLIVRDMEPNRVYAGSPAEDVTGRLGEPYRETSPAERMERMEGYLAEFYRAHPEFKGTIALGEDLETDRGIRFDVKNLVYAKTLAQPEIHFMRFLLPWRAKFLPRPERDWVKQKFLSRHGEEPRPSA